jgi:hypothetical protein
MLLQVELKNMKKGESWSRQQLHINTQLVKQEEYKIDNKC